MEDYIPISTLNDFIFCPYSIYLHNIYIGVDEELYHAFPQTVGKAAHLSVDSKKYSTLKTDITSLSVFSEELGVMGKIDLYKQKEKLLIERKYQLKNIYIGHYYQLWAQYYCMLEMGYQIESLAFYETSINKMHSVNLPTEGQKQQLIDMIEQYKTYNLESSIFINKNKCMHCIYCSLCDKTNIENVYS